MRLHERQHNKTFKIGFGSCIAEPVSPIWKTLQEEDFDLFIFLGDTVYFKEKDLHPYQPDTLRKEYENLFAVPSFQDFLQSTKHFAIWDDHDFAANNSDSTFEHSKASFKLFKEFWHTNSTPESFHGTLVGKQRHDWLQLLSLDNRSYRVNPPAKNTRLLGPKQLAWLLKTLRSDTAAVTLIASGGQLLASASAAGEPFGAFPREQTRFIEALRKKKSPTIIISGDLHYAEILKLEDSAHTVIEVTSSPLSAPLREPLKSSVQARRIASVYGSKNYGVLEFFNRGDNIKLKTSIKDELGRELIQHYENLPNKGS